MKQLAILIILGVQSLVALSQDTIQVVWDDANYCDMKVVGADTVYQLKNSLPDGFYKHFHKNTILINQGLVQDKLKQGVWAFWKSNGTLDRTETYKNDLLNGPKKVYYENGMLKESLNFKNGKEVGHQLKLLSNGKMWSKKLLDEKGDGTLWEWKKIVVIMGEYKNWVKDGYWKYKSTKDGSLIKEEYYVKGKLTRKP